MAEYASNWYNYNNPCLTERLKPDKKSLSLHLHS